MKSKTLGTSDIGEMDKIRNGNSYSLSVSRNSYSLSVIHNSLIRSPIFTYFMYVHELGLTSSTILEKKVYQIHNQNKSHLVYS